MINCIYWDLGNDEQSIQSRSGVLFFLTIVCTFFSVQFVILVFPDERPVFTKEISNGLYSPISYFIAKLVSEIPMITIFATLVTCICYFAVDLSTESTDKPFIFFAAFLLQIFVGTGIGFLAGILIANKEVAAGILPLLIVPQLMVVRFIISLILSKYSLDTYPIRTTYHQY